MLRCVWITAFVSAILYLGLSEGQTVTPQLSLNGAQLANNSFVSLQKLLYPYYPYYYYPITCELIGATSVPFKKWYLPNGTLATVTSSGSYGGFGQTPYTTGVYFYSAFTGSSLYAYQGVHRCELTDQYNTTYQLFVGLYAEGSFTGTAMVGGLQFQLLKALPLDAPVYQLTCVTAGAPATTVQWTINGAAANGNNFVASQSVVNGTTSTYRNILLATGKLGDVYSCAINSSCGTACGNLGNRTVSASLSADVPPTPTGVTVTQLTPTSLMVSWIMPNLAVSNGYYIFYGTEKTGYNTSYTTAAPAYLTGLQVGVQYAVAVSTIGYTVSSWSPPPPVLTIASLLPTTIFLSFSQPAVPLGVATTVIGSYELRYIYTGPCPGVIHKGSEVIGTAESVITILGVQEYSTYNITLVATKNGGSSQASLQLMTPPAAPASAPFTVVEVARGPTSLTIGWSALLCVLQNSLIVKYVVRYGQLYGSRTTTETTEYFFTANGLVPYTSYTFEVAAVNAAGERGPFSAPFIMDTLLGPILINSQAIDATSVLVSWAPSDGDGTTRYSVSYAYQGQCSGVSSAGMVYTTATQYTIQSLQEYSTYAVGVRAERGGQVTVSNSTVSTLSAAPSAPPSGLSQISKTTTKVSVGWGPVPCINRDSDISKYRVRYKSLNNSSAVKQDETFAMVFTATELDPYTDYSFEVAAINTDGLVGPYTAPLIVRTLQPAPPVITITTDGSTPTDQGSFSMNCSVPIPPEALGTVTIRWFSPQRVVLNSVVTSDVGGEIGELELEFTPIRTQDGGWYTCDVTFELYPQSGASKRTKVTVQSDALFQLRLGPLDGCLQWLWEMTSRSGPNVTGEAAEKKADSVQAAVFGQMKSILARNQCPCEADTIDWVYSCPVNSSDVVFKYSLHLTSDHCACSGSKVVSVMDQWVKSAGSIRMGRYVFRASHGCKSTRIGSLEDPC